MKKLLEYSKEKQRLFVVSGDLDSRIFDSSLYEESFSIYTDNIPRVGEYIGGFYGSGDNPGHFLKKVNGILYSVSGNIFIYIDKTVYGGEDETAEVVEEDNKEVGYLNEMLERHKNGIY